MDSPRFQDFCVTHGLVDDPRDGDGEDTGFRPSERSVTRRENKDWPGVLIMETCPGPETTAQDHREFLIPLIGLRALKHVIYKTLVRSILKANPGTDTAYSDMQLLWDAIINKVYYFACACEREAKVMEVGMCRSKDSTEVSLTGFQ